MITKKNQQKLTFFIILLFNSLDVYPVRSRARLRVGVLLLTKKLVSI